MKTRTTVAFFMITAMVAPLALSACGGKVQDAVTETGNPSLIDKTRITTTPLNGALEVAGSKDAVPADAEVRVTNERTKVERSTKANSDGSFSLEIAGKVGDELNVQVNHDGKSDTVRVTVEPDPNDTTDPDGETTAEDTSDFDTTDDDTSDSDTTDDDTSAQNTTDADTSGTDTDTDTTAQDTTDDISPPMGAIPQNHRAATSTCDNERAPGDVGNDDLEIMGECASDDECQEGTNGRCYNMRDYASCTYDECTSDDDCEAGPCECGGGLGGSNECMDGNCRVDTDCGDGGYCSPSQSTCGSYSGIVGYWCHTPEDECVNDDECVSDQQGGGYCMYSSEVAHWLCSFSQCLG